MSSFNNAVISILQITYGDTSLAYTEYDRESEIETVAFMEIGNVLRCNRRMPNHMAMYQRLSGDVPCRSKIFTGI